MDAVRTNIYLNFSKVFCLFENLTKYPPLCTRNQSKNDQQTGYSTQIKKQGDKIIGYSQQVKVRLGSAEARYNVIWKIERET